MGREELSKHKSSGKKKTVLKRDDDLKIMLNMFTLRPSAGDSLLSLRWGEWFLEAAV